MHGIQGTADKLDQDATQYEENIAPMVQVAKKIASMSMKMVQLIR